MQIFSIRINFGKLKIRVGLKESLTNVCGTHGVFAGWVVHAELKAAREGRRVLGARS